MARSVVVLLGVRWRRQVRSVGIVASRRGSVVGSALGTVSMSWPPLWCSAAALSLLSQVGLCESVCIYLAVSAYLSLPLPGGRLEDWSTFYSRRLFSKPQWKTTIFHCGFRSRMETTMQPVAGRFSGGCRYQPPPCRSLSGRRGRDRLLHYQANHPWTDAIDRPANLN